MSMQDNPLYDQLSALLRKAGMLVTKDMPEARGSMVRFLCGKILGAENFPCR